MSRTVCALLVTGLTASTAAAADPPPKRILVLPAEFGADVGGAMASFTARVVVALHQSKGIAPVTPRDLDALARAERLHDLLGCTATSCLAELAGAAGVEQILSTRLFLTHRGFSCFLALHDVASAETVRRREIHGLRELDADAAREVAAWIGGAAPKLIRKPVLSLTVDGAMSAGQADTLAGAVEMAVAAIEPLRIASDDTRVTHDVTVDVTTLEVVRRRHHIHRYLDGTLVATLRISERATGALVFTRQVRTTHSARARYSTADRVVAELCQDAAQRWSAAIRANPF